MVPLSMCSSRWLLSDGVLLTQLQAASSAPNLSIYITRYDGHTHKTEIAVYNSFMSLSVPLTLLVWITCRQWQAMHGSKSHSSLVRATTCINTIFNMHGLGMTTHCRTLPVCMVSFDCFILIIDCHFPSSFFVTSKFACLT